MGLNSYGSQHRLNWVAGLDVHINIQSQWQLQQIAEKKAFACVTSLALISYIKVAKAL
ncbi:hypothetical protein QWI44_05440 [Acinetobacter pittii]|nr:MULTISPECIES: hypothetical protein [Acinetobacter]MDR0066536.1 hypothetical protein [Acinetobacter sp. 11520]MCG9503082.1 hypothetical protein [Acinetobacter pittii]MCH2018418.1 hypothetical protein [Acinetobacter pittii]MCK0922794.1 hypothetical protein [Acinetobacter pittii]MDA3491852.1 hypothetical protein [Acinetobacter sp. AOR33_HL]